MPIRNIHHVACVVPNIEDGYAFWRDIVGLPVKTERELPEQGVKAALLSMGNTEIELLEPIREDTGVDRYLKKTGGGMHHICFETGDVQADLDDLKAREVQLIDQSVRKGLAGDIFFVHPKATSSVLVEYAQPEDASHPGRQEPDALFLDMPLICASTGDLWNAARQFEQNFGLQVESYSASEELDNRHVMIPTGPEGAVYVEVMTPLTPDGKNAEFLQKRGEGLFLMAARVRDLNDAVAKLRDAGVRVTDPDEAGTVAFVHPKSTNGVFIEILPNVEVH
jgi:methylmalonyl-CoA/ethylmalonyl-CoA epimerase